MPHNPAHGASRWAVLRDTPSSLLVEPFVVELGLVTYKAGAITNSCTVAPVVP